ncbi:MAG: DedA family protein [Alphaproteobacteria bacterium]|nr:DedA family protein [Alphaproteobacteria bacterium]
MDALADGLIEYLRTHQAWAGPVVGVIAFLESLAVIGFFVPGWGALIAIGGLVGAGVFEPWPFLFWGTIGASAGDAISFWIARAFKSQIPHIPYFRDRPALLDRGHRLFERWGALAVFIGRFFGPARAVVPVCAGLMDMTEAKFQIANVASALVWVPVLLAYGASLGYLLDLIENVGGVELATAALAAVAVGYGLWRRRKAPPG